MIIEIREETDRPGYWWVVVIDNEGKAKPVRGPMSENRALAMAHAIVFSIAQDKESARPTAPAEEIRDLTWSSKPVSLGWVSAWVLTVFVLGLFWGVVFGTGC